MQPRIDFYYSFRSPYSYLAFPRAFELPKRFNVSLEHRPIRPMVTRGVPLSPAKLRYILHDCKRIAARLNIKFGPVADPLGEGIDRCLAVTHLAWQQGKIEQFVLRASRGIWAEGVDVSSDRGLAPLCAEAGLDWKECQQAIRDRKHIDWIEGHVSAHGALHWGVPTFVVDGEVFWGQDRLGSLEKLLPVR